MTDLQVSSVHYFQRPDQDYVKVDSQATSLGGFGGRLVLNKQKGPLQLNASLAAINPGLELNDIGFAPRTDLINSHVVVGYRWTKPTSLYQRTNFNVAAFGAWDFGWDNTGLGMFANGNMLFRNFWSARTRIGASPQTTNIRATRGGPAILNPQGFDGAVGFSSDDRKRVVLNSDFYYNRYQQGADNSWGIDTYVEWRPMQRLQLSVGPSLSRNLTSVQYIDTYADPTATNTYGSRYVFGDLDQWTLSGNIRLNWIFTPKLSLELFMQPFVSSGNYRQFSELAAAAHVRLQRVRAERVDLRSNHRRRRPGRPGWPGGGDRHRGPELPVCVAARKRGAAVGVVAGLNAVRGVDAQPGQFDQHADGQRIQSRPVVRHHPAGSRRQRAPGQVHLVAESVRES